MSLNLEIYFNILGIAVSIVDHTAEDDAWAAWCTQSNAQYLHTTSRLHNLLPNFGMNHRTIPSPKTYVGQNHNVPSIALGGRITWYIHSSISVYIRLSSIYISTLSPCSSFRVLTLHSIPHPLSIQNPWNTYIYWILIFVKIMST